jgi:hypothetical protein
LLQDIALRHGGQLFAMRNADIVLLCAGAADCGAAAPMALPAALARLFGSDAPEPGQLTSLWRLDAESEALLAYVAERQGELQPESASEAAAGDSAQGPAAVAAVDGLIDALAIEDAVVLQTAVRLRGPGPAAQALPLAARVVPAFRDMSVSLAALSAHAEVQAAIADPFLLRHFAARLDARILVHLHDDLLRGGKLTRPAMTGGLPIHVTISLGGIVSEAFARLCHAAAARGVRFGVGISLMDAASDMALLAYARTLLRHHGFPLVLEGVDHVGLTMTHPGALQPDLVKLIWSPRLADAAARPAIEAAIARIGAGRIVLQQADSEAALLWGQRMGVASYQGFFLDAVLAVRRVAVCHSGRHCTMRQCINRAATLQPAVRTGCGNPALLDMASDHAGARLAAG